MREENNLLSFAQHYGRLTRDGPLSAYLDGITQRDGVDLMTTLATLLEQMGAN
jgi:hypothetical protein